MMVLNSFGIVCGCRVLLHHVLSELKFSPDSHSLWCPEAPWLQAVVSDSWCVSTADKQECGVPPPWQRWFTLQIAITVTAQWPLHRLGQSLTALCADFCQTSTRYLPLSLSPSLIAFSDCVFLSFSLPLCIYPSLSVSFLCLSRHDSFCFARDQ